MAVDVSVVPKLAAAKSIGTRMSIGKNIKTGELYAEEYGNQVRGQMSFDDLRDDEEEHSSSDSSDKTVVDFRNAKQA